MKEQLYLFVDKSGHCFEDFQTSTKTNPSDEIDEIDKIIDECFFPKHYRDHVGAMLSGGKKFSVGDMMFFKQDLTDAGFKWGIDFYVIKAEKEEE